MFIKPIVKIHGMYSHVGGTIPTNFMLVRPMVMETHGTAPTRMITKGPTIMTFVSTMLPLDPRGEPLVFQGGFARLARIFILLITHLYRRPFNYFKYKKDSNLDARVRVFKATIKVNGDLMLIEEIKNLSNFTLKDNALNWCNNYMRDFLNHRFADLEQIFCRQY
jgi:hypothetical protein